MVSGVQSNKPRPFHWAEHKQASSNNVMNSHTKVVSPTEQEVFHESTTSYEANSSVDSKVLLLDNT